MSKFKFNKENSRLGIKETSPSEKLNIRGKQITAVELFWILLEDSISKQYYDLFQRAKAMEKEQIIEAYQEGEYISNNKINAEEYYNETYKK